MKQEQSSRFASWMTWFFYSVAGLLLYVTYRVVFRGLDDGHGRTALYLLTAAAGVVFAREVIYFLPNLIKFKGGGIELELKEEVVDLKQQVEDLVLEFMRVQGMGTSAKNEAAKLESEGSTL